MSSKGNLVIISAPSGTGKTSLASRVLDAVPNLKFSVSHTTRQPRSGETPGVDYFFVTTEVFETMIAADAFLEWAHVYGNYYGTSREFVESELEQGNDVLLDIDVQGARKVKDMAPDALTVFVLPPSQADLEGRLKSRRLDNPAAIKERLKVATDEIQRFRHYDYLIINERIETSAIELQSIILAARCRIDRRVAAADRILETFSIDSKEKREYDH